MKLKSFLSLCFAAFLVSPVNSQTPAIADSSRTEDVCEAALRYFFAHDGTRTAKAICISTSMPLPPSFINRFASNDPQVVCSIECTSDRWAGAKYVRTNEPAALFKITSIRWVGGEEAEVKGGLSGGDFVRPPYTIHVIKRNGRWLVKSDKSASVFSPGNVLLSQFGNDS
jgi:hypothetical protein